jgi:hypothetical protein
MARELDGTTGFLSRSSAIVSGVPATLAGWVYLNSLAAEIYVIGLGNSSGADGSMMNVYVRTTGAVRANAQNSAFTGTSATTTATISTGSWHHVCAVFTSATSRAVFLDGANKATNATSVTIGALDRSFIGGGMEAGFQIISPSCRVAEVGIWNVALTDAEVACLGAGMSPKFIRRPSLVEYVPIYGNDSPELGVKGNPYTVNGTIPKVDDHPRIFTPTLPILMGGTAAAGPPPPPTDTSGMFFGTS